MLRIISGEAKKEVVAGTESVANNVIVVACGSIASRICWDNNGNWPIMLFLSRRACWGRPIGKKDIGMGDVCGVYCRFVFAIIIIILLTCVVIIMIKQIRVRSARELSWSLVDRRTTRWRMIGSC